MKQIKIWHIAAFFFAVCCVLNLCGCLTEGNLERCVKPALLPLLCLATVAFLAEKKCLNAKGACLLVLAQLFGCAGDTALLGEGFVFFAMGIALFLVGHIFYICLFGSRSWKGLKAWQWILAMVLCVCAVAALIKAIGINGALLAPMGIYGFTLTLLVFSTLAGALRFGSLTWWLLAAGAVLFMFSDSLIAIGTFKDLSPIMRGFGVMFTYLLAQTLLAIGSVRLIQGK